MSDDVRYFRVSPKFWGDHPNWSDDDRLLALYLLTCPHRTTEGLFRLPKFYICGDLQWLPERLAEPLAVLVRDGFIRYDEAAQVVLIVNAMRYQQCANPNAVTSALRRLNELPDTPLTSDFKRLAERFDERLAEQLPEPYEQPHALTQAHTQAQTLREGDADAPPEIVDEPSKGMREWVEELRGKGVEVNRDEPRAEQYRKYVHAGLGEIEGLNERRGKVLMALRSYAAELGEPLSDAAAGHAARLCGDYGPRETFDVILQAIASGAGLDAEHAADDRARTKYAAAVLKNRREEGAA